MSRQTIADARVNTVVTGLTRSLSTCRRARQPKPRWHTNKEPVRFWLDVAACMEHLDCWVLPIQTLIRNGCSAWGDAAASLPGTLHRHGPAIRRRLTGRDSLTGMTAWPGAATAPMTALGHSNECRAVEAGAVRDYDVFTVESKADVLEKSREYWNPGKTGFWVDTGVDLVIDRREDYYIWDMSGARLIDVHVHGGTFTLGHRNGALVDAITAGMRTFDIGNHHFPSSARAALAAELIRWAPPNLTKVVYGSGGGEAIDIALKTARHATRRRRIVSIAKAYHGHTGLAVATGDDRFSRLFLSDRPDEFSQVPFNDLGAMEAALAGGDVAAVIMETIPATYGFPLPEPGYLEAVKAICERHGTLYIADEVQTGLMRTGEMWAITKHGIEP